MSTIRTNPDIIRAAADLLDTMAVEGFAEARRLPVGSDARMDAFSLATRRSDDAERLRDEAAVLERPPARMALYLVAESRPAFEVVASGVVEVNCRCGEPVNPERLIFGRCPACGDVHDPEALGAAARRIALTTEPEPPADPERGCTCAPAAGPHEGCAEFADDRDIPCPTCQAAAALDDPRMHDVTTNWPEPEPEERL